MTEAEIRRVVAETVEQTLTRVGLDHTQPLDIQQDLAYLRSWRKSSETIKRQSFMTAVGVITTGILALIWMTITQGRG